MPADSENLMLILRSGALNHARSKFNSSWKGTVMGKIVFIVALILIAIVALVLRRVFRRISSKAEEDGSAVRSSDYGLAAKIAGWVGGVSFGICIVVVLLGSFYTQDPGEAIVLRSATGRVINVDTSSGLGFKAPWVSTVSFDIRNQRIEMFTNDGGTGPDGAQVDLGLRGGASANTSVVVRYSIRPDAVLGIYNEFKSESNLLERELRPATRDGTRDAAAEFEAFTIKEERGQVATDIEDRLTARWEQYGIIVDGVDIGNINLDAETEASISQVNVSRQGVETARNELNAARITAERTKVDAQAEADADQIIRCGASTETVTEMVADEEVEVTQIVPLSGAACENRLNEQVLISKYLDALEAIGADGNMVVVIPNDTSGGASGPIINLPRPQGEG